MMKSSGAQKAADNVEVFQSYLSILRAKGEGIPLRPSGGPNLSQIAKDSGIGDRARFYTNDRLKEMLANVVASNTHKTTESKPEKSKSAEPDPQLADAQRRAERRAQKLEQANAALVAENAELRRQLREVRLQLGREDMIIETGRRIPAPKREAKADA